ncbi:aminotransferase class I/II-fold pyridoxal phosphate-dependent enzyme [Weissella hellenica]|nr:aminotransferase class I/II-fold pyridoxal phosphate-dependent enzyme [Weissella hellenica]
MRKQGVQMPRSLANLFSKPSENIMSEIGKTAALMTNVIDLSIGDPDMVTATPILTAAKDSLTAGNTHYSASDGDVEYLKAIIAFYQEKFGLSYTKENVRATVGAGHATFLAFGSIINPNDEVIIFEPYFSPYKTQVEANGGKAIIVTCEAKNGFQPTKEAITAAISDKTKAILVNTPNNPTGAVYDQELLQVLADLAKEHDFYLIADEVYWPFVYGDHEFTPLEKLAPNHTLVTGSLSKVFAMTGFRIGYLAGPADIIDAAGLLNEGITFSAPSISQTAGTYALNHIDDFTPALKEEFGNRLNYVATALNKLPWLNILPVAGSIYLFADISASGMDDVTFSNYLLDKVGVLVIPGRAFGDAGRGYIRIAVTQDMATLAAAVRAFEKLTF